MMKISLINANVKFKNNQIISISSQDIEFLSKSCLIKRLHKKYLLCINYRTYQISCPIEKNANGGFTITIPAFKVPNSNIPIFVHLYSVALYLSSRKSMRKVATQVKKIFGLETYSHTTISRTLKRMIAKLDDAPNSFKNETFINKDSDNHTVITRRHWQFNYIAKANKLLRFLSPVLIKHRDEIIRVGTQISYSFYLKNKKYCI